MNVAVISGNLTRDPEVRETKGDTVVVNFGVAVEENVKNGDSWDTKVHFVDCTIFGGKGQMLADKARKGDLVFVTGSLDFYQWESEDGTKRNKLSLKAREVGGEWRFRKRGEEPAASPTGSDDGFSPATGGDDDIPF